MIRNVGGLDRTARIVLGIVLVLVGLFAPLEMTWRIVALVVGIIGLATGGSRYCPLNQALGINTAEGEQTGKK